MSPRARGEIVRPRLQLSALVRPLNFTVRHPIGDDMANKLNRVRTPFRGSRLARRIGSAIFGVFIAVYLSVITARLFPRLPQRSALTGLLFVWASAALALTLIARDWLRSGGSPASDRK